MCNFLLASSNTSAHLLDDPDARDAGSTNMTSQVEVIRLGSGGDDGEIREVYQVRCLSDRKSNTGSPINRRGKRGQGLVEFMLILPPLLLLILGIIEFGRLMVAYSSLSTATRDAARYAASVGEGATGVPHYQDCDGIRGTVARLALFTDLTVVIEVDADGPGGAPPVEYCQVGKSVDDISVSLGSLVVVRATTIYEPLLPIVQIPPIPITSETKRTIMRDIFIK
jgi:hypothetical protein